MADFTGEIVGSVASGGNVSGDTSSSVPAAEGPPPSVGATSDNSSETAPIVPSAEAASPVESAGPLPFDRHKAILDKQRSDSAKALADLRTQFGPIAEWHQRFQADPAGFAEQLIDELSADPQHAQSLRSRAGKILAAARRVSQTPEPSQDTEPAPDYVNQSTGEQFYSATQQKAWLQWNQAQMERKLMAQIAPLQQDAQQREMTQRFEAMKSEAWSSAKQTLEDWAAMPGFTEHKAEIATVFAEMGQRADLGKAYARVVGPKLTQTGRAQALSDLRQKASAGTVNPNAATVSAASPAKKTGSFLSPESLALMRRAFQGQR